MKKVILTSFVLLGLAFSNLNAQDEENMLMSAGNASLEVQFLSPFVAEAPFQMDHLRGRIFVNDNMAVRLGLNLNINSQTDEWEFGEEITVEEKFRVIDFGLFPGIEMHLPVGNRVSPYVGAEVGFATRSTLAFTEDSEGDRVEYKNHHYGAGEGFNNIVVNLVSGVDMFAYKGLYLGAELGFGLGIQTFKDSEVIEDIDGESTTTTVEDNRMNIGFGDNINGAIRLGWAF